MNRIKSEKSLMTDNLTVFTKAEGKQSKKAVIRVVAYCRVSTDLDSQKTSLENQMEVFEEQIKRHPGWKLCGIYVDKGLTGTSVKSRPEFQRLIKDAEEGKIDYIITKSISRFSRNTVDLLTYVRRLKEVGVGIFFEEQKLDTSGLFSEIILTIHGAFAQEESQSISENMKSGKRKRYAMGIPQWFTLYGYCKGEKKGEWKIVEKEAEMIRLIFNSYVEGKSLPQICRLLDEKGCRCVYGGKWQIKTISDILHNEKYIGDVIMQKLYKPSVLNSRSIRNDGSVLPRYYLQDHHSAIIDRQTFLDAQVTALLKDYHRGSHQYPYQPFLRCPYCAQRMVAVSLPRNQHGIGWTCGGIDKGFPERARRTDCPPYFIKTKYIDRAVLSAFDQEKASMGLGNVETPQTVEYSFLREYVDYISFARCEERVLFDQILILWKNGKMSCMDVDYEKPCEFPVAVPEWIDGQYYADGVPMGRVGGSSRNIYVGRLLSMDFCNRIRIYNKPNQEICPGKPEFGTIDIPTVIAPDSTKKGDINYE